MKKNEFLKMMSAELRLIRIENNDTQEELAKKCGVAPSTISKYENSLGKIYIEKLAQIISPYNISISIFFERILAKTHKN